MESAEKRLKELPDGQMVYAAATSFKPQGNFKPTGGAPRDIHILNPGTNQRPGPCCYPRDNTG